MVRGVLHRHRVQAVFVDTPGLHRPRTQLGRRLNEHVADALEDVDVAVAVVDALQAVGPGDQLVLRRAAAAWRVQPRAHDEPGRHRGGLIVVVNKVDRASPAQVLERLAEASAELEGHGAGDAREVAGAAVDGPGPDLGVEYFPVSATTGEGVDALVDAVLDGLPVGPPYFPEDVVSDQPEMFWVAELVREQLLSRVHDELPHAIATRVTEWEWPRIRVEIVVERPSQKGIVIGQGGTVLKDVGTAVRRQLPPGAFLELHVTVEQHWQDRRDAIERLGY
jgi:GTP-binding protein Era